MAGVAVMVRDKYAVRLVPEQRQELQHLIRVGKHPARVTARARVLFKSDDGWPAPQVAEAVDVALGTVYRVKQRFFLGSARYPFPRCCFRMAQSCLAVKSEMSNREFDPSDESPAAGGSGFRENPSSDLLQLISKVVQGAIVEDWIA